MIQRKQTVYMLASVIAILMMLVLPLGTIESAEAYFDLSALGISSVTEGVALDAMSYDLLVLLICMLALPLVCIFLYNKRKLQLQILIYTAILDILFYVFFFAYETNVFQSKAVHALQSAGLPDAIGVDYNFTLYVMPALSLFCSVMAWRYVTYDIALLASADRLRPSRKK